MITLLAFLLMLAFFSQIKSPGSDYSAYEDACGFLALMCGAIGLVGLIKWGGWILEHASLDTFWKWL